MVQSEESAAVIEHSFDECPECSGELQYQTKSHALCLDCRDLFSHEIRADRHLLWGFTDDLHFDEVVARAE